MIDLDLTVAVVALLGFAGLLLQEWRHDRVRRQDRADAREDAQTEAKRANVERWIAEVETYVNFLNSAISDMRLELIRPQAARQGPGRERLQLVNNSVGIASAAASLLDPHGGLTEPMGALWEILHELTKLYERADAVPEGTLKPFFLRAGEATLHIMRKTGELRERE